MKLNLIAIAVAIAIAPALAQGQTSGIAPDPDPIIYGLVIDTTRSLDPEFKDVIEVAKMIVTKGNLNDQAFVISFVDSSQIEIVRETTSDKAVLVKGLSELSTRLGQSAVTDAIHLSIEKLAKEAKASKRRAALVLITDGEDRNSFHTKDQLFYRLREEKIRILAVGFVNGNKFLGNDSRKNAIKFLERLAKSTGGRTFFPTSSADLPGIADTIVGELRSPSVTLPEKARPK